MREQVEKLAGVDSANADHTTGKLTVTGDAVYDDAVRPRSRFRVTGHAVTSRSGS